MQRCLEYVSSIDMTQEQMMEMARSPVAVVPIINEFEAQITAARTKYINETVVCSTE